MYYLFYFILFVQVDNLITFGHFLADEASEMILEKLADKASPVNSSGSVRNIWHFTCHEKNVFLQVWFDKDHNVLNGELRVFHKSKLSKCDLMCLVVLAS